MRRSIFDGLRKRRVIDALRARFPHLSWRYERGTLRGWHNSDGWRVTACSALAPRYDGDDDTFRTVYVRSDTGEQLLLP